MDTIAVLGCGWLGLPLATHLRKKGYILRGSTTSVDKTKLLRQSGIDSYIIELNEGGVSGPVKIFLKGVHILIIGVPPKAKTATDFPRRIAHLIPHIHSANVMHVIFISSTSVYADENLTVTEETTPAPETLSGKNLVISEQLLRQNSHFQTTIVRFGGLIGPERHPVKFLSGRYLENCDAPVNLIQQADCIGIISAIIEKAAWGEIFNAVAPYHPARKDYYTNQALELKIPPPVYSVGKSVGKTVTSHKLADLLEYRFLHPEL